MAFESSSSSTVTPRSEQEPNSQVEEPNDGWCGSCTLSELAILTWLTYLDKRLTVIRTRSRESQNIYQLTCMTQTDLWIRHQGTKAVLCQHCVRKDQIMMVTDISAHVMQKVSLHRTMIPARTVVLNAAGMETMTLWIHDR